MRRAVMWSLAGLVGLAAVLAPRTAAAWTFREHEEIGTIAYARACVRLRDALKPNGEPADPSAAAQKLRWEIACQNVDVNALVYGKATGTAGDRIDDPDEFVSAIGAFRATSRIHYLRLKLVNSRHFHPKAPQVWREYHRKALVRAAEAAALVGGDQLESFELALYESAFGDHFLHDSFAAGHMGFNRPASSAGATLVFHDAWNDKGRIVRNRKGDSWRTFGDGRLGIPANTAGRTHVLDAATESIYGVLHAFTVGQRSPDHELAIWRELPFNIEAPEDKTRVEKLLAELAGIDTGEGRLEPLAAVNQPATKSTTIEAWASGIGPLRSERPVIGVLGGLTANVPFLSPRVFGGLGLGKPPDEQKPRLVLEVGILRQVGLTNDGVLSHEIVAGVGWQAQRDELRASARLGYRVVAELGRTLIRLEVGPAYQAYHLDDGGFGYYAAFGVGWLMTARGGGAI